MSLGTFGVIVLGFGLGLAVALLLTPLARRFALRKQVLDHPSDHKLQEAPVPYLGGVAIVLSFAVAITAAAATVRAPAAGIRELMVILAIGVAVSLLGLVDDVKGGLSPWLRLAVQSVAASTIVLSGISVGLFGHALADGVLTVVWIVAITNAFNLLDNMDGLSAGVAVVAAGFFAIIAVMNGQYLVAPLAAALAGCALGFLRSNFHPAKIYMGDAGSLFLGFVLAVIGVKLNFPVSGQATFLVPVLVLGVAIFDTALVSATRVRHGRSPFQGGRDHTSHRLVISGLSVPAAVTLIYGAALTLGVLAFTMVHLDATTGVVLLAVLAVLGFAAGVVLARVPVYESQQRHAIKPRAPGMMRAAPARESSIASEGASHATGADTRTG